MKVDGTFAKMQTLAKMTRAALKIWQFVARYSTKLTLCQGLEGDLVMASNSRRVFADAAPANYDSKKGKHIAFDDKCKLIPEEAILFAPSPQVQVVALADWESAPAFLLEEHWGKRQPVASKDSLLNKCNPFLSDNCSMKRLRLRSDDVMSEAPTMSTDCSSIPENYVGDDTTQLEDYYEDEHIVEDNADSIEEKEPVVIDTSTAEDSSPSESVVTKSRPTETSWSVHWKCVGYGRYEKTWKKAS